MNNNSMDLELIRRDIQDAEASSYIARWVCAILSIIAVAISANISNPIICLIAVGPAIFFWYVGTNALKMEKAYKMQYENAMQTGEEIEDLYADAEKYAKQISFWKTLFNNLDTATFYLVIIIALIILGCVL